MGEINFVITGEAVAGPTGPAGPAGADSTVAGADGVDGTQGPAGADGADGIDGADGADGIDGADGADGTGIGIPGPQGPQGETGQHGHNGTDGGAISTFTKATLPLNGTSGLQAFITDGTTADKPCIGYFYLGKWYRVFDNSLIKDNTATNSNIWTPSALGMSLWFDANDPSTFTTDTDGTLLSWNDKSVNNDHAITLLNIHHGGVMNNKNTMVFNISSKMSSIATDPFHYQQSFIVCEWDGAVGANGVYNFTNYAGLFNGGIKYSIQLLGSLNSNVLYEPSHTAHSTLVVNGSAQNPITYPIIPPLRNGGGIVSQTKSATMIGWSIGSQSDHTIAEARGWTGKIAEVLIFDTVQSAANTQKIEGYLAHKWGLDGKLPSSHPYKITAPITEIVDNTVPVITNIVHIATPSTNKTPLISFYSNEIGTITSTLSFSQTPSDVEEMYIITFDTLPFETYTDETITITDTVGNPLTFTIETFEVMELQVDIQAMTMTEYPIITFETNAAGTFTSTLPFSSSNVVVLGSNTIIFDTLTQGSYIYQNVVIHDNFGNSWLIHIPDFDISGDVNGTPIDNIGDKLIWLDADDDNTFASDVFEVNYWNDKSEYGRHLTPDTRNDPYSSIRVRYADGTHSVQFNWSPMKNSDFNIPEGDPYTFYIVMKCNDQDGKNTIFDSSGGTGRNLLMTNGSSLKFLSGNSYSRLFPLGDVRRRLLVGYLDGANSTIDIGDGDVEEFSGGPPTLSGLVVGGVAPSGYGNVSNSLKGDIHEFIIFNGGLNTTEDTTVRNYLNTKWFPTEPP